MQSFRKQPYNIGMVQKVLNGDERQNGSNSKNKIVAIGRAGGEAGEGSAQGVIRNKGRKRKIRNNQFWTLCGSVLLSLVERKRGTYVGPNTIGEKKRGEKKAHLNSSQMKGQG